MSFKVFVTDDDDVFTKINRGPSGPSTVDEFEISNITLNTTGINDDLAIYLSRTGDIITFSTQGTVISKSTEIKSITSIDNDRLPGVYRPREDVNCVGVSSASNFFVLTVDSEGYITLNFDTATTPSTDDTFTTTTIGGVSTTWIAGDAP